MALKVGDAAPDFKVACSTGDTQGEFQLSAHRGKNVVILFYPLDFTPVCESELAAFQKELGGVSFPMATDRWPYAKVAEAYGVFPPARHTIPFVNDRAIFVVDKEGKIAWSKIYEIGTKPLPSEVLEVLDKLSGK